MKIAIPELALVVLIGPSGSGKSTFARQHFRPSEILTSDACRGLVADDENDQFATADAFEVLHLIAAKRLARGRLTVVDATNVQPEARRPLVALAREYHVLPVAIVLDLPEELCRARNRGRPDRDLPAAVIHRQIRQLHQSLRQLEREGFRRVFILSTPEDIEGSSVERQRLWNDLRDEHGPLDIIGDVHGCADELEQLLERLGYTWTDQTVEDPALYSRVYRHPQGCKAVFLGDLVDRGPRILDAYQLVRNMVKAGTALCLPGNHDIKLLRKLRGRQVTVSHGLEKTLAEVEALPDRLREPFCQEMASFFDGLIGHYVLDGGKLVVAHAGMKENMQGRASGKVRDFALYGETTGETDEFGLPVRQNWAAEYRGRAFVVYGHTPVPQAEWLNHTINIDTGCVFGGHLTALRYPELELVDVAGARTYAEPARPFPPADQPLTAQQQQDQVLDLADVVGKRVVQTRLSANVTIREENSIAALEVMSRFAVNPKWLIYLPPTMSPSATSAEPEMLEHPVQVFSYYRRQGVARVVCEEKHMGSRAIVLLCRDEAAARRRFGVLDSQAGTCYTRTGRPFFEDRVLEAQLLAQLRQALTQSGFWAEFQTDWVCLDCELLPWSVKAQELLRQQYAAVGACARAALSEALEAFRQAAARGLDIAALNSRYGQRAELTARYVEAYGRYCWPVRSLADIKLAPFHLLATEGHVHVDQSHLWHLETLARHLASAACFQPTESFSVETGDPPSEAAGGAWWEELTARGGEGMVVKPFHFLTRGRRGAVQPATKCRGREYLRIIYGPEYTLPEHLARLRQRNLAAKRSLALREFALGVEALERFVRKEPLYRVHECVFGVLALESEPVDPRL